MASRAPSEEAVSEVLGTLLLVTISVVLSSTFAVLILRMPGPTESLDVDLVATVSPGGGGWGTGDEVVSLRHEGGPTLRAPTTTLHITINGTRTTLSAEALASAFADGRLTIGEQWNRTIPIALGATVLVQAVHQADDSASIISTTRLVAGDPTP